MPSNFPAHAANFKQGNLLFALVPGRTNSWPRIEIRKQSSLAKMQTQINTLSIFSKSEENWARNDNVGAVLCNKSLTP